MSDQNVSLNRAFEFAAGSCWAITKPALTVILDVARRVNKPDMIAVAQARASRSRGVRDDYGPIAVVNVIGPIFRYANVFSQISGATSVQAIAAAFHDAIDEPRVAAVVLNFDSPGGDVAGISELSRTIYDARGVKSITAYVDNEGASAAYWLASACDRVVASPTAILGAIGVLATATRIAPEDGETSYEFVSSVSPKKNLDPASQEGQDEIQALVDDLGEVFVRDVARNRGIPKDQVVGEFGQGGVLIASKALAVGMVDKIGSFAELVHSRNAGASGPTLARTARDSSADCLRAERFRAWLEECAALPRVTPEGPMTASPPRKDGIPRSRKALVKRGGRLVVESIPDSTPY